MYAGTKFNWYDQSGITETVERVELDNQPLFFAGITADKGTEELVRLSGEDFYKMYGRSLSFTKHGQPLLQAGRIIDAGAELLVKRVVAEDATLSNIILVANVTDSEVQSTDENGNLLYTDADGAETTAAQVQKKDDSGALLFLGQDGETTETSSQKKDADGNLLYVDPTNGDETTDADDGAGNAYLPVTVEHEPVMVDCDPVMIAGGCVIKWEVKTVASCKKYDDVLEEAAILFDEDNGVNNMIDKLAGNALFSYVYMPKTERSSVAELATLLDEW